MKKDNYSYESFSLSLIAHLNRIQSCYELELKFDNFKNVAMYQVSCVFLRIDHNVFLFYCKNQHS